MHAFVDQLLGVWYDANTKWYRNNRFLCVVRFKGGEHRINDVGVLKKQKEAFR